MLTIVVPETKLLNEETFEIVNIPRTTLKLEHSLLSISKWESIWKKPYLQDWEWFQEELTHEMLLSYIKCMTINGEFSDTTYASIRASDFVEIQKYINDPMTATRFAGDENRNPVPGQKTTSEEIYQVMFECGIPKECEKWHINRLLTLIRAFAEKNNAETNKKSPQQQAQEMYNRNMWRQKHMAEMSKGKKIRPY